MAKIVILDKTDVDDFKTNLEKYTEEKWTIVSAGVSNYSLSNPETSPMKTHYWAILSNEG
jgi:hypothetical protein